MKNKNKLILGFGALALIVGLTGILANSVSAYKGDPSVKGPNYSTERHEAMENAFETNNYDAWKNLMDGRGRVSQVITKDNFEKFASAHKLAESGDLEGAKKIRQELGLNLQNGSGQNMHNKSMNGMHRGYGANR